MIGFCFEKHSIKVPAPHAVITSFASSRRLSKSVDRSIKIKEDDSFKFGVLPFPY